MGLVSGLVGALVRSRGVFFAFKGYKESFLVFWVQTSELLSLLGLLDLDKVGAVALLVDHVLASGLLGQVDRHQVLVQPQFQEVRRHEEFKPPRVGLVVLRDGKFRLRLLVIVLLLVHIDLEEEADVALKD